MVDDFTPQDPMQMPPEGPGAVPPPVAPEKAGFLSTTKGKVIVILVAVLGLGLVAALGVGAFLLFFVSEASDVLNEALQDATTATTSQSGSDAESDVPLEPEQVALSDVFTFRDIFAPLIVISDEDDGTEDQEFPEIEPDTLYLHDIVERDETLYAVLIWESVPIEVPEGAEILGSPWQVLLIGTDSVTMLYGDEQITLIVGQGISTGPATPDVPVSK